MQALSSLGSFLTTDAKPLNSLLGLAGLGTNIYSGIQNIQSENRAAGAQKYVTNLLENPTKMAAERAKYTQPLTAGLTSDIGNQVQAGLAERGLSSSPAAYTQQLTAALAPYILQQQQQGQDSLMSALGLLSRTTPSTSPMTNISQLLAQLKMPAGSEGVPAWMLPPSSDTWSLSPSDPGLTSLIPEIPTEDYAQAA